MEKSTSPPHGIPRRFFLAQGGRLLAFAGVGALGTALGVPGVAWGQDWGALRRSKPAGGHGTVKKLSGRALAAGRSLAAGGRVASGEEIRVAPASHLILSLSDNTILRINANTRVVLEVSRHNTGFFRLLVGSLLTVMPSNNRYLVHMPTATVGIKGTIFFHQVYHPDERSALDPAGKAVPIPAGIREYFCLCNGLADFLGQGETTPFFTDQSTYHNSYFVDPRRPNPMVRAPQLNHTDGEILELVARQDGPKHATKFIENYRASYPAGTPPGW